MHKTRLILAVSLLACALVACSKHRQQQKETSGDKPAGASADDDSGGIVQIDGSSTVFPITEAVAEEFQKKNEARVTIGISGTGGGFKKFCGGETAITGASRPIKPTEVQSCNKANIDYIELPVAYDGIAVVVHPDNDWVDHMTVDELKTLWEPAAQGKIKRWNQIRASWPDKEIHLFGPGVDSGTYDYFTKAIVGEEHKSRGDLTSSEDDNVLVQGVSTDPLALGFFGYAYYAENEDKLKLVPIDDGDDENGEGPIKPSPKTVTDGTYQPLSRPIFIYVRKSAAKRQDIAAFVDYYLQHGGKLAESVGYIGLPERAYELAQQRFSKRVTGSVFAGEGARIGVRVEELLESE